MSTAYEQWIGREETHTAHLHSSVVNAMAATLDLPRAPVEGEPLPPGWQWLFFNPVVRRSALGSDGHPERGGFLPPIALPRRMWAGSRLDYVADIAVGAFASRTSRIVKVENKTGKRGALWFVTVAHTTTCDGEVCIVEEQDIVYREATPPGTPLVPAPPHEDEPQWGRVVEPDTTLLFRYSALTFNGHRIHYDQDYARHEEGYPDLVVHGPLTATLLQQLALEHGQGRALSRFSFRGVSPLFVGKNFTLEGHPAEGGSVVLWARAPDGALAMSATATYR